MLIPQSLAYALLAGLPPEAGLYASMAPLLAYAVFGSSRVLAVGPVAVVSLMTAAAIAPHAAAGSPDYWAAALVLALLSGLMLLVAGGAAPGLPGELPQPPGDLGLHLGLGDHHRRQPAQDAAGHPCEGRDAAPADGLPGQPPARCALADPRHRRGGDRVPVLGAQGTQAPADLLGPGAARGGHAGQGRTGGRHRGDHGTHLGVRLARARREDRGRHPGRTAAPHLAILRRRPVGRAGGAGTADRRGGFRRVGLGRPARSPPSGGSALDPDQELVALGAGNVAAAFTGGFPSRAASPARW